MTNIDKHISDLLYWHNCVIIPGLGGFVANYAPASIHPVLHTFTPPSKNIAFNKNLQNNDGLLANHISIVENKTFHEANNIITNFADRCNDRLKSGERIEINRVGTIYSDFEQNLQFEPAMEVNYLLHAFGLTGFQSAAIKRDNFQRKIEKQFKDRPAVPLEIKKKYVKKYWTLAAALPLLLLMLMAPLSSDILNGISIDYFNLNPFSNNVKPIYHSRVHMPSLITGETPEEETVNLLDVADTVNIIQINLFEEGDPEYSSTAMISVKPKEIVDSEDIKTIESKLSKRFYVIGGCFELLENAENLILELKEKVLPLLLLTTLKG